MKGIIKKLTLATWGLTLFISALSSQAQIVEIKPIHVPPFDIEKLKAIEPMLARSVAMMKNINLQEFAHLEYKMQTANIMVAQASELIAKASLSQIPMVKMSMNGLEFIGEFDLND